MRRSWESLASLAVAVVLWLGMLAPAKAQEWASGVVFGVRELDDQGPRLQGAYVGYRLGPWVPMVSYDRLRVQFTATMETTPRGQPTQSETLLVSGTAHMPSGGVKYLLREPASGVAVPYVSAMVGRPILGVKLDLTGDVTEQQRQDIKNLERRINEALPSVWVIQGTVGGEYFVSQQLALSAEAGLRYVTGRSMVTDSQDFDGDGVVDLTTRLTLGSVVDFTFVSVGLSYYF